ncbi:MAG: dicarboxylate/amino acid:cation symporter [Kiritimatiellaeota bacterium]|nr:dicarboxylate/amino acid:cation symporter [Kiritimatiellota bacterium]
MRFWRWQLHWQILLGIGIGVFLGVLSGKVLCLESGVDVEFYGFVGDIFLRALKMLIVPLIAASIVTAMSKIGRHHNFSRLGAKTLLYYMTTTLIAVLVGLTLVNILKPGVGGLTREDLVFSKGSQEAAQLEKVRTRTAGRTKGDILNVFKEMVPSNIIDVAGSNNRILGVIIFSLLFGFFMSKLKGKAEEVMTSFWDGFYQIMISMTRFVIKFLPIGVCFMIAKTVTGFLANQTFLARLGQIGIFTITVFAGLAIHMFIVMPLLLRFIGHVNPLKHFKAMRPALLTAFSTASSSATLPLTMECVENNDGVSPETSGFVLPLGATVNMDGTALYECVSVLFITQIYGLHIGFTDQFVVVVLAILTSIGVAGIPSASLVAIVIILNSISARLGVHIGLEAIAIILIVDRILDMCRTAVNVFGDSCGAVIIAKSEGETDVLTK